MSLAVFRSGLVGFVRTPSAMAWTFVYPMLMLCVFVALFAGPVELENGVGSYRYNLITGLLAVNIFSMSLFGLGVAMNDSRLHNMMLIYAVLPSPSWQSILSMLLVRTVIVFGFSWLFFPAAFWVYGVDFTFGLDRFLLISASLFSSTLFCFAVALPVLRWAQDSQTILSVTNFINLYAIFTCDVFIPASIFQGWTSLLIATSPFYYLSIFIRAAFETDQFWLNLGTSLVILAVSAILISIFAGSRYLLTSKLNTRGNQIWK